MVTRYRVDPDRSFSRKLKDVSAQVRDLSVPLTLIGQSWFKSNKAFFLLKGPGKFTDLSPGYKVFKTRHLGSPYPILRLSGQLEASLTEPDNHNAISRIVSKRDLFLGTKVPYAGFLQHGTKRMPKRPFVMIGAEQTGPDEFNKRREAWVAILDNFMKQKLRPVGRVK